MCFVVDSGVHPADGASHAKKQGVVLVLGKVIMVNGNARVDRSDLFRLWFEQGHLLGATGQRIIISKLVVGSRFAIVRLFIRGAVPGGVPDTTLFVISHAAG